MKSAPEKVKSIRLKVYKMQIGFCIFSSRLSADTEEKNQAEWDNTLGWFTILNSHMTSEKTHMGTVKVDIIKASPAQIPKH